ncbi:tol-pal system protein YbgF [Sulfurisoma sediminicola]|uniref:Cell division coordinator CpoB n=1 Tax=Sulfurisoma sediminicola TaxID=1381557 RepID=A0A497XKK5_9PROT|nr:tol-pal system protein YbgF [Sulfurisoma sediminicola]RLJ68471.1 tol-pal system protein YbgF [Sulfurisoma sediminicola]
MRYARLLVAACAAAFSVQVQAGLFDDEEARARVEKLRAEITELTKRVDTASKNQFDFANQFETLKGDISRLRGQIEVLTYELDAAQKRQKDFYVDLDNRLRKLEPGTEAKPAPDAKTTTAAADPAAETRDYEAALGAFRSAKYKDALALLSAFIKNYPKSAFQPSAHYWAASSHYQLKDYARAAELFGTVASTWPDDTKAPDALLNQANAFAAAGDAKSSRKSLELLVEKYPSSQPAQGAKLRLKKK